MEVINRKSAREAGLVRYFTGTPCPQGHVSQRYVYNAQCYECKRQQGRGTPAKRKAWNKRTREAIMRNPRRRAAFLKKLTNSMAFILRRRIRSALKGEVRIGSAVRDLGCTITEFKLYIEQKFKSGMTWNNWGKRWQLDHKTPLASFDLSVREQFLRACHYTNLQPLSVKDHLKKSAREMAQGVYVANRRIPHRTL